MDERGGGNEGIVIRARIGNVEGCAALGHSSIDREYAAGECWQDVPVHPGAKNPALLTISPLHQQDSYL
jgi:hypothetical protein